MFMTVLFVQKHHYNYVYCTCRHNFLIMISLLPGDVVASDMAAHDMRCIYFGVMRRISSLFTTSGSLSVV